MDPRASGAKPAATRILITGAGGFTGSHLAQALRAPGVELWGLFADADERVPPGIDHAVVCDLRDAPRLAAAVRGIAPHGVAHLAGISFVAHGDAESMFRINVEGSRNLLDALAALPVPPRITLMASSANVYGNATAEVIDEDTPPAPVNDYARSKLDMEQVARSFAHRLPVAIVRPFNYTGLGQGEQFLVPKIVRHILQRAECIELGNLDVARDFSDVRDVAHCYRRLLEVPELVRGGTFNLCSGVSWKLREILALAQQLSGHHMEVRVNSSFVRPSEVATLRATPRRLEQAIGPVPRIAMADTLRWMLAPQAGGLPGAPGGSVRP